MVIINLYYVIINLYCCVLRLIYNLCVYEICMLMNFCEFCIAVNKRFQLCYHQRNDMLHSPSV